MWLSVNWIRHFFEKRDFFFQLETYNLYINKHVPSEKRKAGRNHRITVGRHGRRVQTQMVTVFIYSWGNITRHPIWCWGNSVFGSRHTLCLKGSSILSETEIFCIGSTESVICVQPLPPWQLYSLCCSAGTDNGSPFSCRWIVASRTSSAKEDKIPFVQFWLFDLVPSPFIGITLLCTKFSHSVSTVRRMLKQWCTYIFIWTNTAPGSCNQDPTPFAIAATQPGGWLLPRFMISFWFCFYSHPPLHQSYMPLFISFHFSTFAYFHTETLSSESFFTLLFQLT